MSAAATICTFKGRKTFVYQYRLPAPGEAAQTPPVRYTIGRYGSITPEQARKVAEKLAGMVAHGIDPRAHDEARAAASKEAKRRAAEQVKLETELAFGTYADRWLADYEHEKGRRPSSIQHAKTALNNYLRPALANKPMPHIERDDLQQIIDAIPVTKKATRRNVFAYASILFGWALRRGHIEANPVAAMEKPSAPPARERVLALAALDAQAGAQRESVGRQFASPLKRYAENAQDSDQRVAEAAARRIEQLNNTIADAMTNALGIEDRFLRDLISIFLDKNIFGPLAEALGGAGGGGGSGLIGAIGSLLGGLFGRASGGPVMAGRAYRVNEGAPAGRVEAFVPNTGGQIIPLGRMNAMTQGGAQQAGGTAVVRLELSGDIDARIERVSGPVAIEVVRATAPGIVDAAASETARRFSRPTL